MHLHYYTLLKKIQNQNIAKMLLFFYIIKVVKLYIFYCKSCVTIFIVLGLKTQINLLSEWLHPIKMGLIFLLSKFLFLLKLPLTVDPIKNILEQSQC